jgi:hypothetical protein
MCRCIHNCGGEICWKQATCQIEESTNNTEANFREINCEWLRAMILVLATLNLWVLVLECTMFGTKITGCLILVSDVLFL